MLRMRDRKEGGGERTSGGHEVKRKKGPRKELVSISLPLSLAVGTQLGSEITSEAIGLYLIRREKVCGHHHNEKS